MNPFRGIARLVWRIFRRPRPAAVVTTTRRLVLRGALVNSVGLVVIVARRKHP